MDTVRFTRKTLFTIAAALGAAMTLPATKAEAGRNGQSGTIPKQEAEYRDTPRHREMCDECRFWIMGPTAQSDGTCQIVAGPISPHGWCRFFESAFVPH
jgi:hypothetical protein